MSLQTIFLGRAYTDLLVAKRPCEVFFGPLPDRWHASNCSSDHKGSPMLDVDCPKFARSGHVEDFIRKRPFQGAKRHEHIGRCCAQHDGDDERRRHGIQVQHSRARVPNKRSSFTEGSFTLYGIGDTEEHLITTVLGHAARGDGSALDRTTGVGRVNAKDGHYADALAKGHGVYLLVFESTGAMSASVIRLLRSLAAAAKRPEVQDTTIYGAGRASPRTFYRHHLAAISSAIARADAQTVLRHATDLALRTVM